jgi:hypothetical protein
MRPAREDQEEDHHEDHGDQQSALEHQFEHLPEGHDALAPEHPDEEYAHEERGPGESEENVVTEGGQAPRARGSGLDDSSGYEEPPYAKEQHQVEPLLSVPKGLSPGPFGCRLLPAGHCPVDAPDAY